MGIFAMAQESFYTILNEMKKYADSLEKAAPDNDVSKLIKNWTERLEAAVMEIIQIDAHDLCDVWVLLMKTIDGINEGKIGAPGNYPTDEAQKYVTDLKNEMSMTINRFMKMEVTNG